MKRTKIKYIFIVLAFSTSMLFFQNCNRAQFVKDETALSSNVAEDNPIDLAIEKTSIVNVTSEMVNDSFKLLLVIDNSASMMKNRDKFLKNLDTLMNSLEKRNVVVGITTTDSKDLNLIQRYINTSGNYSGSVANGFKQSPAISEVSERGKKFITQINSGGYSLADASVIKMKAYTQNASALKQFKFNANDESMDFSKFKESLRMHIEALPLSDENEAGLCAVLSQLQMAKLAATNYGVNSLFKEKNDKAAIVILTDEDDSSKLESCALKSYEYDVLTKKSQVKHYVAQVQGLHVIFSNLKTTLTMNDKISDGVLVEKGYKTVSIENNVERLVSLKDFDSTKSCAQNAQIYLRRLGQISEYSNSSGSLTHDYSQVTVSECKKGPVYNYLVRTVFDTEADFTKNLCAENVVDQTGKNLKSNIIQNGINPSYSNGTKNINNLQVNYGSMPGPLIRGIPSHSIVPYYLGCKVEDSFIASPDLSIANVKERLLSEGSVENSLVQYSKEMFGDNFFVSFIINAEDCEYGMDNTESLGKSYTDFIKKIPNNADAHSICADSYEPALKKIADFVIEKENRIYDLNLRNRPQKVSKVFLNKVKLSPQDFEYSDGRLKITNDQIILKENDIIRIYYVEDSIAK